MPRDIAEIVGDDLVKLKYTIDLLKDQYIFFNTIKQKSITKDEIVDTIETLIEPHLSKIKKPKGIIK